MFLEIIKTFGFIFIAELGDKSQILAMSFATKYKTRHVLIGVFLGIFFNHLIAVLLGSFIGTLFGGYQIGFIVAFVFISFAYLSLLDRGDDTPSKKKSLTPIIAIAIAFFIGELGDKTQLATFALSSESTHPYVILIGSVSAMLIVSYLGIIVGKLLGDKITDYYIRIGSSVIFFIYGVFKFSEGYQQSPMGTIWFSGLLVLALVLYGGMLVTSYRQYQQTPRTTFQKVAQHLQDYYAHMEDALDIICLGEDFCGPCRGRDCLIGHTKYLLEEAKKGHHISVDTLSDKTFKNVAATQVLQAIDITTHEIKDHWDDPDFAILHTIRKHLDLMLFHHEVTCSTFAEYQTVINDFKERNK